MRSTRGPGFTDEGDRPCSSPAGRAQHEPEPLAPFFDAIAIGEVEEVLPG